jgi:hypothetical protein
VQKCCAKNQFAEPNQHVLTFLHPIFSVQGHILSTTEDALIVVHYWHVFVQFIGEETSATNGTPELTDAPTWIVDPLDGTTNFVHRYLPPLLQLILNSDSSHDLIITSLLLILLVQWIFVEWSFMTDPFCVHTIGTHLFVCQLDW